MRARLFRPSRSAKAALPARLRGAHATRCSAAGGARGRRARGHTKSGRAAARAISPAARGLAAGPASALPAAEFTWPRLTCSGAGAWCAAEAANAISRPLLCAPSASCAAPRQATSCFSSSSSSSSYSAIIDVAAAASSSYSSHLSAARTSWPTRSGEPGSANPLAAVPSTQAGPARSSARVHLQAARSLARAGPSAPPDADHASRPQHGARRPTVRARSLDLRLTRERLSDTRASAKSTRC